MAQMCETNDKLFIQNVTYNLRLIYRKYSHFFIFNKNVYSVYEMFEQFSAAKCSKSGCRSQKLSLSCVV